MAYNAFRRARVSTIARNLGVDEAELCRRMRVKNGNAVVMVRDALAAIREIQDAAR